MNNIYIYIKEIRLNVENSKKMAVNNTKGQIDVAEGCETSELKNFVHAEIKQSLQKGIVKALGC